MRRPVIINNYGGGGYGYGYGGGLGFFGIPFGGYHFGPYGSPYPYSYGFGYNPAVTVGLSIADLLIRES